MALGFNATLRNARADAITTARDADAAAGMVRIYDGTRPATGGAATTLLAELTFSVTSAPGASSGVLTASAITGDTAANASGAASWFREVDGAGVHVMDGDIGVSGSDLNLNDINVVIGQPVDITSYVTTEGNA